MPSLKRPGVYAEEVLNLSSTVVAPTSGIAAFIAVHGRGPTTPQYIESWSQYLQHFGGFGTVTQFLPYAVHQYFSNGGRQAYVTRVPGPAATLATITLDDAAAVDTLRVDAANPGTWGAGINVAIDRTGTDTFDLTVRYGGLTDGYVVERWADLSMLNTSGRYAPSIINAPAGGGSAYIRVVDLGSVTVDKRPATNAPAAGVLVGGTDPVPTATEFTAAINAHDVVEGPLTFNMPGVSSLAGALNASILDLLLAYCATRGDCFAVLDTPEGATPAEATSQAGARNSAYGALYYPWIYVSDPSSASQGAVRKLPPGGAVIGQYARTDTLRGVHKAPAGLDNRIAGAVGVETRLTNVNLDDLNIGLVNAIRHIPGVGVTIMGARTLKNTAADRYVSSRRTLNYMRKALIDGTRWAIFEPNDATLWTGLRTNITQFLLSMWQRGALRGGSAEEAFYVLCDAANNDPNSIASGQVNIEVGVALQYPAEFVVIRIGQWEGGATATVTV